MTFLKNRLENGDPLLTVPIASESPVISAIRVIRG